MNDFYEKKAKKYKYKYLKLKSEYIGEGGSGILWQSEAQKAQKENEIFYNGLNNEQKQGYDILYSKRLEQIRKEEKDGKIDKNYISKKYSKQDFIREGCPTPTTLDNQIKGVSRIIGVVIKDREEFEEEGRIRAINIERLNNEKTHKEHQQEVRAKKDS
jgi:hypothetical protein